MKKHVLVIDDEGDIREMLSLLLDMKGYRATAVGTASDALRAAREDPPELIVTDLQMQDTDGLVLVDQLRQVAPGTPVLLLTGVVFEPEVLRENLGKRFTSYLDKTSSLQDIAREIQRLLGEPG